MRDSLGDRMKKYERVTETRLMDNVPSILRVDGRAFHTLTRGMEKPFDEVFIRCMQETAKHLAEVVQGCKVAYVQSDEISLVLEDYDTLNTLGWFDNKVQKMVSISAAEATLAFNRSFMQELDRMHYNSDKRKKYETKLFTAVFDSRVYNVPKNDVVNYFVWRQQDAIRNSTQMIAQANFSEKTMHGKSCVELEGMLNDIDVYLNEYTLDKLRGSVVRKVEFVPDIAEETKKNPKYKHNPDLKRRKWIIDSEIPVFSEERNYIARELNL